MPVSAVRLCPNFCTLNQASRPGALGISKRKRHARVDENGPQRNSLLAGSSLRRKRHCSRHRKCCHARAYAGFGGRDLGLRVHGLPRSVHGSL